MSNRLPFLILLALMLATCAAPSVGPRLQPSPTPKLLEGDEALRRDAQAMATSLGISVDEAMGRFQQQPGIGELNAALASREAGTFAGLWIQQEPAYRVVVAFTRNGEQTIQRYIANTSFANIVEVRTARASLVELTNAQQEAMELMSRLGLSVASSTNIQENRVELFVTDRALFDAALQKANTRLPDHVVAITTYEPLTSVPFAITPDPSIQMSQLRTRSPAFMLALLEGNLVVKDGCLRVAQGETSHLIIWQPDYFINNNRGTLEVLDRRGQSVARVGEEIQMGGGEVPLTPELERQLREPLPPQCGAPYWLMGDLVHR